MWFTTNPLNIKQICRGERTRRDGDLGRPPSADDSLLRLLVQIRTSDTPAHTSGHHPPPELIVLPENGTVANLKVGGGLLSGPQDWSRVIVLFEWLEDGSSRSCELAKSEIAEAG